MSAHETPDQVRTKKIAAMGAALGGLHCDLWNELSWLHAKWGQYCALFGTSEERVNVMNEVAPHCTFVIQTALWRDILLTLCRMTDPARSHGRTNVSLMALAMQIEDVAFRSEVEALAAVAAAKSRFARERRNRYYAHQDLASARNEHPVPLPESGRQAASEAMLAIGATLNLVQYRYENSRTMYEYVIDSADAEDLYLAIDEFAARRRMERQKRLEDLDRWRRNA